MKKTALFIALVMAVSLLFAGLLGFAEDELLTIEIKDGELIVTIDGDFGPTDWIGFYPEDHEGYNDSTIWWYIGGGDYTWSLPDEEYIVQRNTEGVFNEDGLIPGKYFAILLANDGYEPIDDMEPIYFEIKDPSETATDEPAQSTDEPAQPTDESAQPTDEPAQPTDEPAQPTDAPATEVPATEVPATQAPATEVPVTNAPATEKADSATPEPGNSDNKADDKKNGANVGLIIGIVCGVIVIAAVIAAILIKKGKKK